MSDESENSSGYTDNLSTKNIQDIFSREDNSSLIEQQTNQKFSQQKANSKRNIVSIIYYQNSESPKYFEVKKSIFFWWFVVLPATTLLSITIAIFAGIHLSPTHLIQNYLSAKNYSSMHEEISSLKIELQSTRDELKIKNAEILELKKSKSPQENNMATPLANKINEANPSISENDSNLANNKNLPASDSIKNTPLELANGKLSSQALGLSYLSIFKPVQGQKDRTRPAQLSLSGFNVATLRDTINFKFNITPLLPNEQKLAGHILVIMKGETGLQVYPQMSLNAPDAQISYSAGESFATQRFRPVDASFLKPRKSGQFVFTVLIFARNGDLIHTQTIPLFVRI